MVAAAVLATVLVVAVGGGYSASKALLSSGVAYAVDGSGLDRLNQSTGNPDAEILSLAKGTGIRVVHKDGHVYVVDPDTNTVTRVDPGTLKIGPSTPPRPGLESGRISVLVGGGTTALVDQDSNTVQRLDPGTLAGIGSPIKIAGGIADAPAGAVVDAGGVIWVATRDAGTIVRVSRDDRAQNVPVAPSGSQVNITLVGGRPVAVDVEAGAIVAIDPSSLERSEPARMANRPSGRLVVSSTEAPGPHLWLIDSGANDLHRVDLRSRKVEEPISLDAGRIDWGQPVVHAGRVYAPNLGQHRLVVVDASTLKRLEGIEVPGAGPGIDVTLQGGALWANDPSGGTAVVVDKQGNPKTIGKGEGQDRIQDKLDPPPDTPPAPEPDPPPAPPLAPPPTGPKTTAPAADATVPDLTGLTKDQACTALQNVKLTCQGSEKDGGRIGKVGSQDPRPGTTLKPASQVRFVVGLGVTVPKVQGANRDAACSDLRALKLQCVPQAVTLERGKTRNEVFEQQPAEGQRADEGSGITVRFWGDARRLPVPDVSGSTPDVACSKLATAGFECDRRTGDGKPLGTIVAQQPVGVEADEGSKVAVTEAVRTTMPALRDADVNTVCTGLVTSLGISPANCTKGATDAKENPIDTVSSTTPAVGAEVTKDTKITYVRRTGLVRVPSVVGKPAAQACSELAAAGLGACSQTDAGEGPQGSKGTVSSQAPGSGTDQPPGTPMSLAVYSANKVAVPGVVGRPTSDACAAITGAGLQCVLVADSSGQFNTASGQSPAAGTEASAGQVVNVSYDPSARVTLWRLRRGFTGTESDTWYVTSAQPDSDEWNRLLRAGFTSGTGAGPNGAHPLCSAYQPGTTAGGRVGLIDWYIESTKHHSFAPANAGPPGGSGWVNIGTSAHIGDPGPVQVFSITRGRSHYFTSSEAEARSLLSSGNFLAGPFRVFTCW